MTKKKGNFIGSGCIICSKRFNGAAVWKYNRWGGAALWLRQYAPILD